MYPVLPLPTFNVEPNRISVSGVSAGAFMAHQLHIAFSDLFCGAGLIAGGAYQVSQGSAFGALTYGMQGKRGLSPKMLAQSARALAVLGAIAPLKNLKESRIWVFHGERDTTVSARASEGLIDFYSEFLKGSGLKFVNDIDVVHAMPTDRFGTLPRAPTQSPYIVNANYDAAGLMLQHIHGPLAPRAEGALPGEWQQFDQNVYLPDALSHSLDNLGFAYIPSGARTGKNCGIHVVLHGCDQSTSAIGDVFIRHAGYNEWAETNNFVMLYPQARPLVNYRVFNPQGSFDWWGLDDACYALRSGRQMKAIASMVRKLAGLADAGLRLAA